MKKPPRETVPAEQVGASMANTPRRSEHEEEEEEEEEGKKQTLDPKKLFDW